MDFIFTDLSSDDVYPVFKEMEKQKFPCHYITEKLNLYKYYYEKCNNSLATIILLFIYIFGFKTSIFNLFNFIK